VVRDHYRGDHAVAVSLNIVAVDLTPFVAFARGAEVTGLIVVDAFTTVPVVVMHVVAALPLFVADVLLVMGVVVMIVAVLSRRDERGGAKGKKDE
jgi:hypothetical protein